jgi:PadR family transcriptional regulator PadR
VALTNPSSDNRSMRAHREVLTGWLLLMLDGGPTYGYDLHRALIGHGVEVDPAMLYRTLRKLESYGWVQSRWMKSVAGPRRRFYRLTAQGSRQLEEIVETITAIRDFHDAFVQAYGAAQRDRRDDAADDADAVPPADPGR